MQVDPSMSYDGFTSFFIDEGLFETSVKVLAILETYRLLRLGLDMTILSIGRTYTSSVFSFR